MNPFFKNISIYGILPIVGKFIGFFLVPIYARVFQAEEFGQIEMIVTLESFLLYLISMEYCTSIGRYFYKTDDLKGRRTLISSGLWLTVFNAAIVLSVCFLFRDVIVRVYLSGRDLGNVLDVGFLWLALDGVSGYLNVIPRYSKKAKQYVAINAASILFRVLSTIFFVLVLKVGIVGILYGHIAGTIMAAVLNMNLSKELLAFTFSASDAKRIVWYAFPLIPSLIVCGIWTPLLRKGTEMVFSFSAVGLLSFASRITSVTTIFNSALMNAWRPMMYENMHEPTFFENVKLNSRSLSFVILAVSCLISLFSIEICQIIGTREYAQSYILIPPLCMAGYLQIVTQLRGFGPLVFDKTYMHSVITIFSLLLGVALFLVIGNRMGLYGLGIIIVSYYALQYLWLYAYTKAKLKTLHIGSLVDKYEYPGIAAFVLGATLSYMHSPFIVRIVASVACVALFTYMDKCNYHILEKLFRRFVLKKNYKK